MTRNNITPDINPENIRIDEFDYPLPDERIASHPLQIRDQCKLLVRDHDGNISDHIFTDLPGLLPEGAMLIYNNTRVINARLRFRKSTAGASAPGATIEIFCLEPVSPADYATNFASTSEASWTCFVGNSKRWKDAPLEMPLTIDGIQFTLKATRISRQGNASVVNFTWDNPEITFSKIISAVGEIPIPPYLNRSTEQTDTTDYQTVYSRIEGSVAAPTAGLHFTQRVLDEISRRGIQRRELTLHVGAGTFQPVKTDTIGEHPMHAEFIAVPLPLLQEIHHALSSPAPISSSSSSNSSSPSSFSSSSSSAADDVSVASFSSAASTQGSISASPVSPSPSATQSAEGISDSSLNEANPSPIIAVGTTSVRTLESLYHAGRLILANQWDNEIPQWIPYTRLPGEEQTLPTPAQAIEAIINHLKKENATTFIGSTRIIIAPGYTYRIVNGIVTNFHQPKSTLLLLVSAFTRGDWRPIYDHALASDYRFLSYGDACLLL